MLNPLQNSLIIGAVLGDSHVEKNGNHCRIRFDHGIKQEPYVEYKAKLLYPHANKISYVSIFDKRTGKHYEKVRFDTVSKNIFDTYRQLFYRGGKINIPSNIKVLLDKFALLVWYLDDGALKSDTLAFRFHTNNYIFGEVSLLQETLLENFGICSKKHKSGKNYIIYETVKRTS